MVRGRLKNTKRCPESGFWRIICSTAAARLSNDFRISVGTQQINTDTEEGKVSISDYRTIAMSVFKESGSKSNGTLSRVLLANIISNSDAPVIGAVGRRKNGTNGFAGNSDPYFLRQYQNVDVAMSVFVQYASTVRPLFLKLDKCSRTSSGVCRFIKCLLG